MHSDRTFVPSQSNLIWRGLALSICCLWADYQMDMWNAFHVDVQSILVICQITKSSSVRAVTCTFPSMSGSNVFVCMCKHHIPYFRNLDKNSEASAKWPFYVWSVKGIEFCPSVRMELNIIRSSDGRKHRNTDQCKPVVSRVQFFFSHCSKWGG